MMYEIKLKNTKEVVILDEKVHRFLTTDPYLVEINLINNLRKHSSGCVVFQRSIKQGVKTYQIETIYLHKLLAEHFLSETKTKIKAFVGSKNGNKLDCRIDNITYRSRSQASRLRKTTSSTGYTGVYKEGDRYRAVISYRKKNIHLGMFDTPEDAARAYNRKSKELFGDAGKQNDVDGDIRNN